MEAAPNIPIEIWIKICSYLSRGDLCDVREVSKMLEKAAPATLAKNWILILAVFQCVGPFNIGRKKRSPIFLNSNQGFGGDFIRCSVGTVLNRRG